MDDGIELKIETAAPTLYAAMYDAYEKFNQVAKRGAPLMIVISGCSLNTHGH